MSQAWKSKESKKNEQCKEVRDLITCNEAAEITVNIFSLIRSKYEEGYAYGDIVQHLHTPINTILNKKNTVITEEIKNNIDTMLNNVLSSTEQKPYFQGGKSKKDGKAKGPVASDKRVTIDGKKRVVYVGSRGGKYIKKGGTFVRL